MRPAYGSYRIRAVLSDPVPPGLALASVSAPCAGGFPCALGIMQAGATVRIDVTYTVSLAGAGPGPLRNQATVASAIHDPDQSDNAALVETDIAITSVPTMSWWALAALVRWLGTRRTLAPRQRRAVLRGGHERR